MLSGRLSASFLLANDSNVSRALAASARIDLDLEFQLLSFGQGVEHAGWQRRVVKEDLAAVLGAHEAESPIANQPGDRTARHGTSPFSKEHAVGAPARGAAGLPRCP